MLIIKKHFLPGCRARRCYQPDSVQSYGQFRIMFQNRCGQFVKTCLGFTRFFSKLFFNKITDKVENTVKAALFIPCLSEHLYPDSALNMVKVLEYLGVEIDYVENQTCCGQIEYNSGLRDEKIGRAHV